MKHFCCVLLFTLLLYVHKAELHPMGQNDVAADASKGRIPPKLKYECEYKCASREHVCEFVQKKNDGEKCTEECGKWEQICSRSMPPVCRKQCAFTTLKCIQHKIADMAASAGTGKLCSTKCTRWHMVCTVPDDLSPVTIQVDDGSGGKNPFNPGKCLRTCGKWDFLSRCIKWICNPLPQVRVEDDSGKLTENVLADMKCLGSCVMWNKFGTCVQWKCLKMESTDAFKLGSMQRGWWDDFWDTVTEWGPKIVQICSILGCFG